MQAGIYTDLAFKTRIKLGDISLTKNCAGSFFSNETDKNFFEALPALNGKGKVVFVL
jgi:hypothetical protein